MRASDASRPPPGPIVLIDVMDTLVAEPFFTAVPAALGLTREELLAAKHPTSWIEFELGRIEEAEYFRRFFRDGRAVDAAALRGAIVAGYRWLPGMEALLADLCAAGAELHALSNYPDWWRLIEERLRLSRYLRWTFVSCRTGVRKPDPECFLGAARALGVPPARCLFIDDRRANVAAAEAVGMPAVLFTDAASLRAALVARGVLPR